MDDLLASADPWEQWSAWGIVLGILIGVVIVVSIIAAVVLAVIGRRHSWPKALSDRTKWPFRVTLLLIALIISTVVAPIGEDWMTGIVHFFVILLIISVSWLAAQLFLFFLDSGARRYNIMEKDTASARKIQTQMQIVRRLVIATLVIFAVGAILMTFDGVRALGASVLASAGVASIVAGLAAQSVLGNLFAGVQLAFNEAIRVGDVVVVEGEWGRINEITLSYVVMQVWDQRTLVLPCTYFTSTPFENWTKLGRELLGTVYFDLDWRIDVDEMRDELDRILEGTDLWDGKTKGIAVTDAVGGVLQVRVTVSAADSGALWDLRVLVREKLAAWVRREAPDGLPARRILAAGAITTEPESPPAG
ncbi:mechanosensitive ion channel family protein [Microbacter sp. GSS18]|nr:mechanosensitive ion channel family protein [Microbacter sp. GSS18]